MCGIIGIIDNKEVAKSLINGLKCLEYRGYDSSGIATVNNLKFELIKAKGKITALEEEFITTPVTGKIGIGHTRWATHGVPSQNNAHPHQTDVVSVVHNGIIENYRELKQDLSQKGFVFTTETDSEVIPYLITYYLKQGLSELVSVEQTIQQLTGAFAIAVLFSQNPHLLIAARKGSPLAIGYGIGANYIGSDGYALAPLTNKISYLEENDIAELSITEVKIYNQGKHVERPITMVNFNNANLGKGNYPHFMLKEIFEQPIVIADCLNAYIDQEETSLNLEAPDDLLQSISKVTIVACGTSYYAGLIARSWFETITKIAVEVEIASEFRYRNNVFHEHGLCIFISQSGETADTLAALKLAKQHGQTIISITNVAESSMARYADHSFNIYAGPEIGVASTKAFTAQLVTLACFVIKLASARNSINNTEIKRLILNLLQVPGRIADLLHNHHIFKDLAKNFASTEHILYTGRGTAYAVCLEGALKMKELAYIHAEAIAAGELKHGTIALVDPNLPIIVIAPSDQVFEKTASNVEEIAARGGKIILLSDSHGCNKLKHLTSHHTTISSIDSFIAPIIYAIPLQLIAYYTALAKGTDIDQPRNLAKSVTVE